MFVSRRHFLQGAAATALVWPIGVRAAQTPGSPQAGLFRHGVASGDPLTDRVILWTRVTAPDTRSATGPIDVRWQIATDERMTQVAASGSTQAAGERDFTVKVDAGGLRPGATYYYAFDAGGERSPMGRTKTLPDRGGDRLRLGQVSCANYPTGYFNVYRCLANRPDLDVVLHLGDYIYEFPNSVYSDPSITRPVPTTEAITLADYRARYALYRTDVDLQAVHAQHPFIVVWDDHELANDAWSGGAGNHNAGEGDWQVRRAAAYQAYREWMPIRESNDAGVHLYRTFRFGALADLIMLDTRGLRDRQVPGNDRTALNDPRRQLLGAEQEAWLAGTLRASQGAGTGWRLLGQQILFSPLTFPGTNVQNTDVWSGYPAARDRVFDMFTRDRISNVAILTGDVHSSWALDVAPNPWTGYDPASGTGSMAVELVTPAVSSPPLFQSSEQRDLAMLLKPLARHLKFLEGDSRGYVLLDVRPERIEAEWYHVPSVKERSDQEKKAAGFVCERGSARLVAQ